MAKRRPPSLGLQPCHFPALNMVDGSEHHHRQDLSLPTLDAARLQIFCRGYDITLGSIIQLAWGKIVRAYSGADEVCFGYIESQRDESAAGINYRSGTLNTCAIDFSGASPRQAIDVLRSLQNGTAGTLPNELEERLKLNLELQSTGQAMFNTAVSLKNGFHDTTSDCSKEKAELDVLDPSRYDISVAVSYSAAGVDININYACKMLCSWQAAHVNQAFSMTLDSIIDHPHISVGNLTLESELGKLQVLNWNNEIPKPVPRCIHDLVEHGADNSPYAVAIDSFEGEMTFLDLSSKSSQLANHLITLGVKEGTLVPIAFEKSVWTVVAMLGIMKAGAGFVPLDPGHPDDRLASIIAQTGNAIVLASESKARRMQPLARVVLTVTTGSYFWASSETAMPLKLLSPTNMAYTLFTSGSTGVPKGVLISHLAASSSISLHGNFLGCNDTTRMLQFSAYTFDACIFEIFTTLAFGGTVCIPSDVERMGDVPGFIARKKVNAAFMTPSLVRILDPLQVPSLEMLIIGGENVGQDNISTWATRVRLFNAYGPTETCVYALFHRVHQPDERPDKIGRGVVSQPWIINLDDSAQLAPIGAVGMLYLSGPALAHGYLGDVEKTNGAFSEAPDFLPNVPGKSSQRAYKTGDLARYNPDGTITFVGRKDQQIKLRGQRIELTEIERHMQAKLPHAWQIAAEIVYPADKQDMAAIAAFICFALTPDDGQMFLSMSSDMLREFLHLESELKKLLPPYELPSFYIPAACMPTTTAGKLDRKALRVAVATMSEEILETYALAEGEKKPFENEAEAILALAWAKVLDVPISRIGAQHHFFRLGGDSIKAMRLVSKLRFNQSLTVSDVFRHPILSDMAYIASSNAPADDIMENDMEPFCLIDDKFVNLGGHPLETFASACNVHRHEIEDAYPCTPLQEGVMLLSILHPGTYIMRKVFRLQNGCVDIRRFKKAWEETIEANPILRTMLVQTGSNQCVQVVTRDVFQWRSSETLESYLRSDRDEGMALGTPLSRFAITDDDFFVWTAHHSVFDGWSVSLIFEEVCSRYSGAMVPRTLSFNRYIGYLSSLDQDKARQYWTTYLSGGRPVAFPELNTVPDQMDVSRQISHDLSISRQKDSSIPMATILRAAWAYVLAQYTNADDVIFGMTLSGRNCPINGIASMPCPTITTVPIRIKVPTQGTVSDFLSDVQSQAAEMIPFECLGLQNIARISAELSSATHFQNLLVVQPLAQFLVENSELLGAEDVSPSFKGFDTFPLVMQCSLGESRVNIQARFDERLISYDQVTRVVHHFDHIISAFNGATKSQRIRELTMLTPADLDQIFSSNEKYPEAVESTVPEIFAHQVALQPDALAIDAWDGQLTYRELDNLTTAFAYFLVKQIGVEPEVLVPLCFEKSRWAVVAQLSVMKAGGACVNIDPAHPASRLELIVADTRAKTIVVAPHLSDRLHGFRGLQIITFDETFVRAINLPGKLELPHLDPSNMAYVLFTSGSTGRPKGIIIEHRSICTSSEGHGSAWDVGPSSRVLQFASYAFDISCADHFTTLQRGGCICIPSEYDRLNDLTGAINRFQCNWTFLTPTVASLLPTEGIPSLKKLILAGEASSKALVAKWHGVLDLIIAYGPAETTIYCSGNPPATATSDPANLGLPIGVRYWVADATDFNRLVPIGCTGELLLEGPLLARGYLNDEAKTSDAFVLEPSWTRSGNSSKRPRRFYRTGDLVRSNGDGTVNFVGRKDTQVKIRGQRVELGEIEHAIRLQVSPSTQVVVDVAYPAVSGNRQTVVAFLQTTTTSRRQGALPLDDPLKNHLLRLQEGISATLPSYFVPSLFIPVARIPLTANGKADRRQMRELASSLTRQQVLEYGLRTPGAKSVATSDTEVALRDLWASVLGMEPSNIGLEDHFFRIGGDSILAMRLASASVERKIALSVRDFFQTPILSDLAKVVQSRTLASGLSKPVYRPFSLLPGVMTSEFVQDIASQVGTHESNIADILPSTDYQAHAAAHAMTNMHGYRNYLWLDGTGSLDSLATLSSLDEFVARHDILRMIFAIYRADIVQVILNKIDYEVEEHDTEDDITTYTSKVIKLDMGHRTNLVDPLIKFFIIKAACKRHRIVLRLSHAQYDGLCLPVLWSSLGAALEGRSLLASTQPMSRYMEALASQNRRDGFAYWTKFLYGSNMTSIVEHKTPSHKNGFDLAIRRTIATPSFAEHGVTFATLLKSAWALVLSSFSTLQDVTFGHIVSGRALNGCPDVASVLGCCLNTIPVRVILQPRMTILELVQAVQSQHAASLPYEAVIGSRAIVRECSPWPKFSRFSSIVQHQNIDEESRVVANDVIYDIGFLWVPADEADIMIKTTPQKNGTMEVLLLCSSTAVGMEIGHEIHDRLCRTLQNMEVEAERTVKVTMSGFPRGKVLPLTLYNNVTTPEYMGDSSHDTGHSKGRSDSQNMDGTNDQLVNGSIRQDEKDEDCSVDAVEMMETSSVQDHHASMDGFHRMTGKDVEMEEMFKSAWRSVLKLPHTNDEAPLDEDSDFFEAGGDFVSAAMLAAVLHAKGIGDASVENIIDTPELGKMVRQFC